MINDSLALPSHQDKQADHSLKSNTFTLNTGKQVFKNVEVKLFEDCITFEVKVTYLFILVWKSSHLQDDIRLRSSLLAACEAFWPVKR